MVALLEETAAYLSRQLNMDLWKSEYGRLEEDFSLWPRLAQMNMRYNLK